MAREVCCYGGCSPVQRSAPTARSTARKTKTLPFFGMRVPVCLLVSCALLTRVQIVVSHQVVVNVQNDFWIPLG